VRSASIPGKHDARRRGGRRHVLMSDHYSCGIIIVVVAWEDETTSSNLPIPDDGILPYAAIAPRDQDPWLLCGLPSGIRP
jgi:hypothetical protein